MSCSVEGCQNQILNKKHQLCQKHYFRLWRNGTTDLKAKGMQYRYTHTSGYQLIYEPDHPLAQSNGYVYEHRFVLFNERGHDIDQCEECGKPWGWDDTYNSHVDHIDTDKSNNKPSNLRPLCNSCNVKRCTKPKHQHKGRSGITYNGKTMTAEEWSREPDIAVSGRVIRNRIKSGWDIKKALTTKSRKSQ